jgi:acylphosphatase
MRAFVSGRVQGVFFRASTAREAARLGVAGWARNLSDGRVEVLAEGEPAAVEALLAWLRKGPPLARVTGVEAHDEDARGDLVGFAAR